MATRRVVTDRSKFPSAFGGIVAELLGQGEMAAFTGARRTLHLQEGMQGGAGRGFLFDGVSTSQAAGREVAYRVAAVGGRCDAVAGHGAEGVALIVFGCADVDDHAVCVGREVVVDSGGDADAAEVGVGADHDLVYTDGDLVDQVKEGVRWLAVTPDDGGVGVAVADGFGCLPVFDDEQHARAGGGIEGDRSVGG